MSNSTYTGSFNVLTVGRSTTTSKLRPKSSALETHTPRQYIKQHNDWPVTNSTGGGSKLGCNFCCFLTKIHEITLTVYSRDHILPYCFPIINILFYSGCACDQKTKVIEFKMFGPNYKKPKITGHSFQRKYAHINCCNFITSSCSTNSESVQSACAVHRRTNYSPLYSDGVLSKWHGSWPSISGGLTVATTGCDEFWWWGWCGKTETFSDMIHRRLQHHCSINSTNLHT